MFAVNCEATMPVLRAPPAPIEQATELPLALKLPLDCAKAMGAINIGIANANVHTNFFMFISLASSVFFVRTSSHENLSSSFEYDPPLNCCTEKPKVAGQDE
ncbi:MAG: hypothetical protein DMG44_14160, partial [Acidobacteria bacterium]